MNDRRRPEHAGEAPEQIDAEGEAHDWWTPVFRTVTGKDGRRAIRLEEVFWEALDLLAEKEMAKRSAYVGALIDDAHERGVNATSLVRSTIAHELVEDEKRLANLVDPANLTHLLQLAPVPSFALDPAKKLVQVNEEFVRYVRKIAGHTVALDEARLNLDKPTESLFAEMEPGTATECGVTIRLDTRERRLRARLVMLPSAPIRILVGYIIP